MISDAYLRGRLLNTNITGRKNVVAADSGSVALASSKTGWTMYIQRLHVHIITSVAQTATFEDTLAATPVKVAATDSAPGVDTHYDWDFGPEGRELTEAKNFVVTLSAAGLAFHCEWEGYLKQTGVEYVVSGVNNAVTTGQTFK